MQNNVFVPRKQSGAVGAAKLRRHSKRGILCDDEVENVLADIDLNNVAHMKQKLF